ncbi:guanine deaminase [Leptolyngbya cf. ectocarpi LEGE 11479]|uniref:Guanine deaminase n=1 Tax=Leptolyngbya cf. ectocarpi LEGE 11479 TaxID=1828722 RepID=A0A929F9D0_LEPEC|nr:guanine deaminase [Leptolyngbya ectocarpi]MBE9067807.1 guanine deaminase [Leptolyngbya cf. ectocarpi LEGE 11479]
MSSIESQSGQPPLKGIRGSFLDFIDDPFYKPELESVRYIADGLMVLADGHIKAFGSYDGLHPEYGDIPMMEYPDRLIVPGFIDTHIHYPQTGMIAAYGEQLLEWLNQYTFPTESKFKDKAYASEVAEIFLDELLRNGTTTALVFASVFPQSVDAFFEVAERRNLCMIAGKVMMDRNAPDAVCDTAASSYQETKSLIQKWHKRGRLHYAVTPRFAITSTDEQLRLAGQLLQEFPDVYLHTHLSENVDEVAWVKQLFPDCQGYLDTYDQAGLVKERSVFAHGVQLTDAEFQRLSEAKSAISFCPTSNLFLGSGLFKLEQAKSTDYPVKVGLGTDVGAGTSFSILQTANEAYKVAQLRHQKLSPFKALFLATLGGARALCLEDSIGNFDPGKAADFIVLNPRATPLMAFRNNSDTPGDLKELADRVFSLVMMGDDRTVQETYILGELAHKQTQSIT